MPDFLGGQAAAAEVEVVVLLVVPSPGEALLRRSLVRQARQASLVTRAHPRRRHPSAAPERPVPVPSAAHRDPGPSRLLLFGRASASSLRPSPYLREPSPSR